MWEVPANEASRYVTGTNFDPGTYTFKLGSQTALPVAATAIYVEVSSCVSDSSPNPGFLRFWTTSQDVAHRLAVVNRCPNNYESEAVWMPIGPAQDMTIEVKAQTIGPTSGLLTTVSVFGYFVP